MVTSVVSDPAAVLASANTALLVCTGLVAAGVVLEFFDLLLFSKEMSPWQRRLLFVASAMVVIGCAGEFIFERQASDAEARLQQQSDENVAALTRAEAADNKIAKQAAQSAAALGVKVDTLPTFVKAKEDEIDRKSGAIRTIANEAVRRDNTAIRTLKADENQVTATRDQVLTDAAKAVAAAEEARREAEPRFLSTAAIEKIESRVCPLGPQPYLRVFSQQIEISLADQLEQVFEHCNWKDSTSLLIRGQKDRYDIENTIAGMRGITLWYPSESLGVVAKDFARGINDGGVAAKAEPLPVNAPLPRTVITVVIGSK